MNCITNSHRQCYKTSRRTSVPTACPPTPQLILTQSFKITSKHNSYNAEHVPICVTAREAWAYSDYFGHQQQSTATCMHTTADAHAHTYACTHTHRTIRSGTYTTRFVKPHKMSKTCIKNSKQYTPKEATAMHTQMPHVRMSCL